MSYDCTTTMTNLWAEPSGNNCSLASHFFVELDALTIGGLYKEVRDKLTTLYISTFFSEWSNLHEEKDMAKVSQNPVKKIQGMDLTFSDTFSSSSLAKARCRQHFLGGHKVERFAFGTEEGECRRVRNTSRHNSRGHPSHRLQHKWHFLELCSAQSLQLCEMRLRNIPHVHVLVYGQQE